MKKLISLVLLCATMVSLAVLQVSCAPSVLYGSYTARNTIETTRNYDDVWNEVVDFFADNGISISNIEKASGLIVAQSITFGGDKITVESKTTHEPVSKDAYIVIPDTDGQIRDASATADFNVRVKNYGDRVVITINIVNIKAQINELNWMTLRPAVREVPAATTSVFENQLLHLFR